MTTSFRRLRTGLRRTLIPAAVAVLAGGGLAACSADADDTLFRYQAAPGNAVVVQLADALGYYDDITLEYAGNVSGGPEAAQAVAAGSVDIGQVYNGTISKIVTEGVPVRAVIAGYGYNDETDVQIITTADSPITDPRDLIGKRVAANTVGASAEAFTDTWLRDNGLTDEEVATVTIVPLPPISTSAALTNGEVDAAVLGSSVLGNLPNPEDFSTLLSYREYYGPQTDGSLIVADRTISERPEQTTILVSGAARAFDWARANGPEATREKIAEYLRDRGHQELLDGLDFWSGSFGVDTPGGRLSDSDFTRWDGWLIADNQVSGPVVPVSDIYTNEFNQVDAPA